jgi:hypothetical protein
MGIQLTTFKSKVIVSTSDGNDDVCGVTQR